MLEELNAEIEATTDLAALARRLIQEPGEGCVKLFVIRQALAVRRRRTELFARGEYRPLDAHGDGAERVCAFARTGPGGPTITLVPRLLAARGVGEPIGLAYWQDTAISLPAGADGSLRNVFTGAMVTVDGGGDERRLRVGDVLADFPVALLEAA
jgi:(1->4)-alpha-D-glucan 1-alpha-D-glucosylmutase